MKKLLLVMILMVVSAASYRKQPNESSNQTPRPAPASDTKTYSNATYGFTLDYPVSMQLVTPTYGNLKDEIVQVQIPKSAAGSDGRRNTCLQSTGRSLEA